MNMYGDKIQMHGALKIELTLVHIHVVNDYFEKCYDLDTDI